jgi:hypothetical protein
MAISKAAWTEWTGALRSEVERAGLANWQSLHKNAESFIGNARYYVRTTPEIDRAFDDARDRCREFAEEISDRGLLYKQTDPASKQAREMALRAIDDLEKRLEDARPSDSAINMGLGW